MAQSRLRNECSNRRRSTAIWTERVGTRAPVSIALDSVRNDPDTSSVDFSGIRWVCDGRFFFRQPHAVRNGQVFCFAMVSPADVYIVLSPAQGRGSANGRNTYGPRTFAVVSCPTNILTSIVYRKVFTGGRKKNHSRGSTHLNVLASMPVNLAANQLEFNLSLPWHFFFLFLFFFRTSSSPLPLSCPWPASYRAVLGNDDKASAAAD